MISSLETRLNAVLENAELVERLRAYYTAYYRDALGIPGWEKLVEQRLREEEMESARFSYALDGRPVRPGASFLNVGCGTGGVNMVAAQAGLDVYGLEPSPDALEICRLKAPYFDIAPDHFTAGVAEHIPFPDQRFDMVYCFTVLEHVQDVKKSVAELVRVTKPGGMIFISIPNYLSFYEGHYKLFWLPKFPKPLARLYLRAHRRPTGFLDTINYITPNDIVRDLSAFPVQIYQPPADLSWQGSLRSWLYKAYYALFGIASGQIWINRQ